MRKFKRDLKNVLLELKEEDFSTRDIWYYKSKLKELGLEVCNYYNNLSIPYKVVWYVFKYKLLLKIRHSINELN